jgi:hypothetical protein
LARFRDIYPDYKKFSVELKKNREVADAATKAYDAALKDMTSNWNLLVQTAGGVFGSLLAPVMSGVNTVLFWLNKLLRSVASFLTANPFINFAVGLGLMGAAISFTVLKIINLVGSIKLLGKTALDESRRILASRGVESVTGGTGTFSALKEAMLKERKWSWSGAKEAVGGFFASMKAGVVSWLTTAKAAILGVISGTALAIAASVAVVGAAVVAAAWWYANKREEEDRKRVEANVLERKTMLSSANQMVEVSLKNQWRYNDIVGQLNDKNSEMAKLLGLVSDDYKDNSLRILMRESSAAQLSEAALRNQLLTGRERADAATTARDAAADNTRAATERVVQTSEALLVSVTNANVAANMASERTKREAEDARLRRQVQDSIINDTIAPKW